MIIGETAWEATVVGGSSIRTEKARIWRIPTLILRRSAGGGEPREAAGVEGDVGGAAGGIVTCDDKGAGTTVSSRETIGRRKPSIPDGVLLP